MISSSYFKCFSKKNKNTPIKNKDGSTTIHIMEAKGAWFINGISKKYESKYPRKKFKGLIDEEKFYNGMNRINDCGFTYFPCGPSLLIGYILAPFTCFLSLFIPMFCAWDMMDALSQEIRTVNDTIYIPQGLKLIFVRKCCRTSWVKF